MECYTGSQAFVNPDDRAWRLLRLYHRSLSALVSTGLLKLPRAANAGASGGRTLLTRAAAPRCNGTCTALAGWRRPGRTAVTRLHPLTGDWHLLVLSSLFFTQRPCQSANARNSVILGCKVNLFLSAGVRMLWRTRGGAAWRGAAPVMAACRSSQTAASATCRPSAAHVAACPSRRTARPPCRSASGICRPSARSSRNSSSRRIGLSRGAASAQTRAPTWTQTAAATPVRFLLCFGCPAHPSLCLQGCLAVLGVAMLRFCSWCFAGAISIKMSASQSRLALTARNGPFPVSTRAYSLNCVPVERTRISEDEVGPRPEFTFSCSSACSHVSVCVE